MPHAALDAEQQRVVEALDSLSTALLNGTAPAGLYLHGAVGRGKTWLCDRFFEQLPIDAKRRVHFHGFFDQLNRSIWHRRSAAADAVGDTVDDTVGSAIASLLDGVDLLYFDEFHVNDSGNAALVHRVLTELLSRGVTLLATSNYAPQGLLPGPFHHVFEPGIELLEASLHVVELAGTVDYRRTTAACGASGFRHGHWLTPGTDAQLALAALRRPLAAERTRLSAGGHFFTAERAADRELWFGFAELCERDTSVADYLEWMEHHDTWVLDRVPDFSDMSSHARQRLTNLVDVLCDRDLTLHIISEHPPSAVTSQHDLGSIRTASRLALLRHSTTIHTQH